MGNITEAGNKGPEVRGDCHVTFSLDHKTGVEVVVKSKVLPLYGESIRELTDRILTFYDVINGYLLIEDFGALDFVISARIEACIKKAITTTKNYLPEMLTENNYSSSKKRMRMSRLYIPGNTPKIMINAGIYKAHAIILDLEDSVALNKKDEARLLVRNALRQVNFYGAERMVRINQLPIGLTDLEQVIPHGVHVVLVPKCESALEIEQVNDAIDRIKSEAFIPHEIFLMPIIESAKGIINAAEIAAAADNVAAIAIGLEDYTSDLGVERTFEGAESLYARSHLVNICKAYGIQAIDSVFSDIDDLEALKQAAIHSKSLGFEGMGCIHPRQIPVIHENYAPSLEAIEKAKQIVTAFDEASSQGIGVVSLGTKMIDLPVVEKAQQTINSAIVLGMLPINWSVDHG